MARGFDSSKYKLRAGILYKLDDGVWNRASAREVRGYNKAIGRPSRTITKLSVNSRLQKYFGASTNLIQANGQPNDWARPLALKGGKNAEYGWFRTSYRSDDGNIHKDRSTRSWGSNLNQLSRKELGKTNIGKGAILNGSREWIRQLQISIHQLSLNAEHFRIAVGHRAIKVFQDSFKFKRFNATGSPKWPDLYPFTKKKRTKRGSGTRILNEYGDLLNSIKIKEATKKNTTSIYTSRVHPNVAHYKKHKIAYGGYHNDPRPGDTYGSWSKRPYVQRQFMGHSDKIDSFAAMIMKRYLFDSVFLIKKV